MDGSPGPGPAGRAVVLGGSGWVGRTVTRVLADAGWDVVSVARHGGSTGTRAEFVRMDVTQAGVEDFKALISSGGTGLVVNCSDGANARDGWHRPDLDYRATNHRAVRRLVAALASLPGRPLLVHLGTVLEYGAIPSGTQPDETTVGEPSDPYGRSKLAGTQEVLAAATAGSVRATVLRLTNVCGPHPSPASLPGKVLARTSDAARGLTTSLTVVDAHRDFVDVRDVADAVRAAAASPATGGVVNIGSGRSIPVREFMTMMRDVSGTDGRLRIEAAPAAPPSWSGADVRHATRALRWRARIGLRESLADTWAAHLGQSAGTNPA